MRSPPRPIPGRKPAHDATYEVVSTSNGHDWINWRGIICCLHCGFLRRADDNNNLCKGRVGIAPRNTGGRHDHNI